MKQRFLFFHEIYFTVSGWRLKISCCEFKILHYVLSGLKNRAVSDIQLSSLAKKLVLLYQVTSFRLASFFYFFICSHNKSLLQELSSSFGNIATCTEHKKLNLLWFLFIQLVIPATLTIISTTYMYFSCSRLFCALLCFVAFCSCSNACRSSPKMEMHHQYDKNTLCPIRTGEVM